MQRVYSIRGGNRLFAFFSPFCFVKLLVTSVFSLQTYFFKDFHLPLKFIFCHMCGMVGAQTLLLSIFVSISVSAGTYHDKENGWESILLWFV